MSSAAVLRSVASARRAPWVIAIDGPAAGGKGALSMRLALRLGFAHLDTGLLYRAVARQALDQGVDPTVPDPLIALAAGICLNHLRDPRLRDDDVARVASQVAVFAGVRRALLVLQRRFAATPPEGAAGVILDGRDIGTVVYPEADLKLFVTASLAARARRRQCERVARGESALYSETLASLRERDARDSNRAAAPLRVAADARVLDTSALTAAQTYQAALGLIETLTDIPIPIETAAEETGPAPFTPWPGDRPLEG